MDTSILYTSIYLRTLEHLEHCSQSSAKNHNQANKYETNNYKIDKQTNMKQKTNKLKQTDKNLQVTIAGHTKTLNWDKEETNYLLSAFFYGYVVMQVQK